MKAKVIKTGEIIDVKEWGDFFSTKDMNHFYESSDLVFLPDTSEQVIEGWATKDYPDDDVLVHLNVPHKWKYHPEDKDDYSDFTSPDKNYRL